MNMRFSACIDLTCPHCDALFTENIKLVRPGATLHCPYCVTDFTLVRDDVFVSELLMRAARARQSRKQHRRAIKSGWRQPTLAGGLGETVANPILVSLDALIARLDSLAHPADDERKALPGA